MHSGSWSCARFFLIFTSCWSSLWWWWWSCPPIYVCACVCVWVYLSVCIKMFDVIEKLVQWHVYGNVFVVLVYILLLPLLLSLPFRVRLVNRLTHTHTHTHRHTWIHNTIYKCMKKKNRNARSRWLRHGASLDTWTNSICWVCVCFCITILEAACEWWRPLPLTPPIQVHSLDQSVSHWVIHWKNHSSLSLALAFHFIHTPSLVRDNPCVCSIIFIHSLQIVYGCISHSWTVQCWSRMSFSILASQSSSSTTITTTTRWPTSSCWTGLDLPVITYILQVELSLSLSLSILTIRFSLT